MPKGFTQITFEFDPPPAEPLVEIAVPVQDSKPVAEAGEATPKSTRGRKKISEAEKSAAFTEVPEDEILFQKQYYSIGEVAQMFKVNNSLLRYWEKEFEILQLRKNRKGDRFFRPADVKTVELIFDLLRRRKYTIDGAKTYLKKAKLAKEKQELITSLQRLRSFLLEIKANL